MVTRLKHAISSVGAASNRDPQVGKCIFGHTELDSAAPERRKRYGCKSVCRCWPQYAAPKELTAIWIPVAIKMLLLRSTISVFQMSKLQGVLQDSQAYEVVP